MCSSRHEDVHNFMLQCGAVTLLILLLAGFIFLFPYLFQVGRVYGGGGARTV